jgi:hypothetical protein
MSDQAEAYVQALREELADLRGELARGHRMSHLADVKQVIEMGHFSYPGGGLDVRMAESAIECASSLDRHGHKEHWTV